MTEPANTEKPDVQRSCFLIRGETGILRGLLETLTTPEAVRSVRDEVSAIIADLEIIKNDAAEKYLQLDKSLNGKDGQ